MGEFFVTVVRACLLQQSFGTTERDTNVNEGRQSKVGLFVAGLSSFHHNIHRRRTSSMLFQGSFASAPTSKRQRSFLLAIHRGFHRETDLLLRILFLGYFASFSFSLHLPCLSLPERFIPSSETRNKFWALELPRI